MALTIIAAIVAFVVGMFIGTLSAINEMCDTIEKYKDTIVELRANQIIQFNVGEDHPDYFTEF